MSGFKSLADFNDQMLTELDISVKKMPSLEPSTLFVPMTLPRVIDHSYHGRTGITFPTTAP
jgi:hypothetical protein